MKRTAGAVIVILLLIVPRTWDLQHVCGPSPSPAKRTSRAAATESPSAPSSYLRSPLRFLSTAPPDSLILLPGIGPVLAERIARARTGKRSFTQWEDLLAINGIGPKKLDRLKSLAE